MPTRPEPVPDLDWNAARARALGEGAVELWAELLERLPSLPVDRGRPNGEVRDAVVREVPERPLDGEELLAELRRLVFDYSMYPGHPGFMAYVSGAGTVPGAVAELVAAGLNQNLGGWRLSPAATEIELAVTRWLAHEFGLPEGAGGLLVSGGAANLVGLKAARDAKAGGEVRSSGVRGLPLLTLYASEEVHGVVVRAADLLGLGGDAVRLLPTDDLFRLRTKELEAAIDSDLAAGHRPLAVVASAGTVATGAIDPLPAIADICAARELWLHVDGVYGRPAVLADDLRGQLAGIERADSIAFDPHKWKLRLHPAPPRRSPGRNRGFRVLRAERGRQRRCRCHPCRRCG